MTEDRSPGAALAEELNELRALLGRRDFAGARALGQRLVAEHPTSGAAHAALGDVAAATRDYREAVEWYELAQRLEPSETLRLQLEQARAALLEEEEWGVTSPPAREPRLSLPLLLGGGFLALCVLVTVITVSVVRHRHAAEGAAPGASGRRPASRALATPPAVGARPATGAGQRAMPSGPRSAGYATPMTPRAPAPTSTPPVTQVVTQEILGPLADADLFLTRALSSLTWPNGATLGANVQAWLDPFTGYALITFQVPPGTPRGNLYGETLDMAYRVALAAVRSERGIESLTIRALATVTAEDGQRSVLVAFRGNTNRQTLDYYQSRGTPPDRDTLWKEVFATTWWNPSVPVQ